MDTPHWSPSGACSQLDAAGKPSSVPRLVSAPLLLTGALDQTLPRGRPFLCPRCCQRGEEHSLPAPYPSHKCGSHMTLLGLARGGVYRAPIVTNRAVRSYRTFSPLPVPAKPKGPSGHRRFILCGTFPRPKLHPCGFVGPGGRYPPPYPIVLGLSSRRSTKAHRRAVALLHQSTIRRGTRCVRVQKPAFSRTIWACPKPGP
jgi:hypothetical protein